MSSKLAQLLQRLPALFGVHRSKKQPSPRKATTIRPLILSSAEISSQPIESFADASRGILTWRTLLSVPKTPTSKLIAGMAVCPAKAALNEQKEGHLCAHRHEQPEIYYIISGQGLMEIEGEEFDVDKGSVVYIPGNAEHGIRSIDTSEDLIWLYVFPGDGFEEVVYRFRGKDHV